ncbi:unnamed protein product [Arabidopsis thaliana]|uniref:Uncharacterized protein n=1 Tax=Arabidopsis thaliana TaxID=3702 RepID=A0A654ESG1_ARATH|nr:unnamed protein product [Arabidopsis thaliana]
MEEYLDFCDNRFGSQFMGLGREGNGPTLETGPIKENPRFQIVGQGALGVRRLRVRVSKLHDGSGAEAITTANGLAKERRRSLREPKGPADLVTMRRRRQGSGWKDWSPMKLKASQTVFFDSQGLDRECSWLGGHILPMSENTTSKKIQQQRRTR